MADLAAEISDVSKNTEGGVLKYDWHSAVLLIHNWKFMHISEDCDKYTLSHYVFAIFAHGRELMHKRSLLNLPLPGQTLDTSVENNDW